MYQANLLNVFLLILTYLGGSAGLGFQVRKLLLPITQCALVDPKHVSNFLDGIIELEILIQIQCHSTNTSYGCKDTKKNGKNKIKKHILQKNYFLHLENRETICTFANKQIILLPKLIEQ
jgi:hypothetical protein